MVYDFYYSKQHEKHLRSMHTELRVRYTETFVNGIRYTEMIRGGIKPHTSQFNDLEKVYSGASYEITYK